MTTWRKVGCCLATVAGLGFGAWAARLPVGYQEVEYVDIKDGATLDTGILITDAMKLTFKFAMNGHANYGGALKDHKSENAISTRIIYNDTSKTDYLVHFRSKSGGGGTVFNSVVPAMGGVIEGYLQKGKGKLNSVEKTLNSTAGTEANDNTFKCISTTAVPCRLWYLTIDDGETPVRNLVPCYRRADNVAGAYDLAEGGFYANTTATGTVTPGPTVTVLAVAPIPSMDGSNGFGCVPASITVTDKLTGATLTEGRDYAYTVSNNDGVGTAVVTVTGMGDYSYEITTATFEITATELNDDNIRVSDPSVRVRKLGNRTVYVFTNTTAEAINVSVKRDITIEKMLVVGGGGAGGGHIAGGGGGGGFVYSEEAFLVSAGQDFDVVVGAGGVAASGNHVGGQGGSSYLQFGDERRSEAYGGGGGGAENTTAPTSVTDGHIGSAGGAAASLTYVDGRHYNSTQGNRGGLSSGGRSTTGGGGAGDHGLDYGQNGGPGKVCAITGTEEVYGSGGGAGGGWDQYGLKTFGRGGVHAGDGAAHNSSSGGKPGDPGFGGGGGGAARSAAGGNGGSGTVILYVADHDTVNFRYAVANPGEQAYLGEPVRPKPAVSNVVTGAVLTEGVDFTYAYENCDTYGRGRVIANGVDGSDYDGCYAFADFDIVNGFQFAVEPIPRQAFLGEPARPSVTVVNTVVGGVLSEDSDYVVAYENNEAVGRARAIVSGMTGTGYEGLVVTNDFVIAETYVDEFLYVADASVRCIEDGTRRVYVFTNSDDAVTLNFRKNMTLLECLVVGGGGGGGGSTMSAGGGAGGYLANSNRVVLTENNDVVISVGKGGDVGMNGVDSVLTIDGLSLTAKGGGYGGKSSSANGGDGGSGGGGYHNGTAGKGTPGQGHDGGVSGEMNFGGGGGGAGGPGMSNAKGRLGGIGVTNAITGTAIEYARGGKGCGYNLGIVREPAGTDGLGEGGGGGGKIDGSNYEGSRGGNGTVILALKEGGVLGQPEFDAKGIELEFLHETSVPQARVTLAGDEDAIYQATVTLEFGAEEGVYTSSKTIEGLRRGDNMTFLGDVVLREGETLYVRATVSALGADDRTLTKSVTVPYDRPPWYGKGGGEGIVHVRSGAFGDGSGSDWLNAVPDIRAALELLPATSVEVWIAGDWTLTNALAKTTLTAPAKIRGGFTGLENALAERPRGARSVLDGGNAQNILQIAGNYLLTLDSIEFTHARTRAVERTGGALFVTNCNFEANGTTVDRLAARALYATGSANVTADFVDTRFAKNTEKGTYAEEGCCVLLSSFKRAMFDNCTFMTNGIVPDVVSGTSGYGEGNVFKGAALKVDGVPLTMRNCRFFANRAACRGGNGGTVRLFNGSYPSAFTNCLFVGNSERQPHSSASESLESGGGAIVLDLGSSSGLVEVDTCTFAWNCADCRRSPAAINVRKGAVKVRNSIFWKNWRRDVGTAGTDIDVKADGSADVDYSLFAATNETCITTEDAAKLTLGAHNVCGEPKFFTPDDDLAGIVKTNANKSSFNFIYFDWNRLDELVRFNAHVRGGRYVDETTGGTVFARGISPAIDAGDPAHEWSNEPKPNGRCVNMGFYGNTPWATMSPGGTMLFVR